MLRACCQPASWPFLHMISGDRIHLDIPLWQSQVSTGAIIARSQMVGGEVGVDWVRWNLPRGTLS